MKIFNRCKKKENRCETGSHLWCKGVFSDGSYEIFCQECFKVKTERTEPPPAKVITLKCDHCNKDNYYEVTMLGSRTLVLK